MIFNNLFIFIFFRILPDNRLLLWPWTYGTHCLHRNQNAIVQRTHVETLCTPVWIAPFQSCCEQSGLLFSRSWALSKIISKQNKTLNWKLYKFFNRCRIYKKTHEYMEFLYLLFYCEWLKGKNGLWVVKSSDAYFVGKKSLNKVETVLLVWCVSQYMALYS
jgi:hypothetical protein